MDRVHAAVAAVIDDRRSPADIVQALAHRHREPDVLAALGELVSLGFITATAPPRWSTPAHARVVPALLALLETRFELFEIPLPASPLFFFAAAPRADADHLLPEAARRASGRGAAACGLTRADALLRCLGEAAELVASCWHGDEHLETASCNEVRGRAIAPNDLMGYSERQYRERDAWNARHGEYDRIPPPLDPATPIAWTEARDPATGEAWLVPAACVYIGFRDTTLAEPFYLADSNGCAVGVDEADAIERGFLEIVERDATGLWWYGQRRCPAVHPREIEAAGIDRVLDWHRDSARSLGFLDISSDFDIPVVVAVSANPDGSHVMLGFGCHFEMPRAIAKAMAELAQMEMGLAMTGGDPHSLPAGLRHWLGAVTLDRHAALVPRALPRRRPAEERATDAVAGAVHDLRTRRRLVVAPRREGLPAYARSLLTHTRHYRCRLAFVPQFDAIDAADSTTDLSGACVPLTV